MAQTLEQINALRYIKGEEPLTELPKEVGAADQPGNPAATEPVTPSASDAAPEDAPAVDPKKVDTKPAEQELNDEAVLAFLAKKGIAATSLDELVPKEDPAKLAEKREADKLTFALSKGIITKKDYEDYIRDSADPQQIVYGEFYHELKAERPELTDEEIRDEFMEAYGLSADPSSVKFKKASQALAVLAERKLKDRYKNVFGIDSAFSAHETSQKQKADKAAKILSLAPKYKSDVEEVFAELKKVEMPFSDSEKYEMEFSDEVINGVKNYLLDNDFSASQILQGWSKETLKDIAYTALLKTNFNDIVKNVAEQHLYKHQAGTRGVPASGAQSASNTDKYAHLTENQRKALSMVVPGFSDVSS